jgi:hypothetical protein
VSEGILKDDGTLNEFWVAYLEPLADPERYVSLTNLRIESRQEFPPGLNRQLHSISFEVSTLGPLDLEVAHTVLATAILHLSRERS